MFRRLLTLLFFIYAAPLALAAPPILIPGAPGTTPTSITAEQAIEIASTSHTAGDAQFMRDMIPHHQQALGMSQLAPNRPIHQRFWKSGRIEAAQSTRSFMTQWLTSRGEPLSRPTDHHKHHTMCGMATPEQMENLAGASANDLIASSDTMITHHEARCTWWKVSWSSRAAYDPMLFEFTNDVTNDQSKEIDACMRFD